MFHTSHNCANSSQFGVILMVSGDSTSWRVDRLHRAAAKTELSVQIPVQPARSEAVVEEFRKGRKSVSIGAALGWLSHLHVLQLYAPPARKSHTFSNVPVVQCLISCILNGAHPRRGRQPRLRHHHPQRSITSWPRHTATHRLRYFRHNPSSLRHQLGYPLVMPLRRPLPRRQASRVDQRPDLTPALTAPGLELRNPRPVRVLSRRCTILRFPSTRSAMLSSGRECRSCSG